MAMSKANHLHSLSAQELHDHAWVDGWVNSRPGGCGQWTILEWKYHFFQLGKSMSYMLRHGAKDNGITLNSNGFIPVRVLRAHRQFQKYTEEEIRMAVDNNAKKRFAMVEEGGVLLVGALQGQSKGVGDIDYSKLMTPITLADTPKQAIHATFRSVLKTIEKEGLKTMGREHIHMATGLPGDGEVISGCRAGTDTFLYIDVRQAIADGFEFLRSGNGVICTPGRNGVLPPKYIRYAVDKSGKALDWLGFCKLPEQAKFGKPASAAPLPTIPSSPARSQLTHGEKNFLNAVKVLRAILKIAEEKAGGKILDKNQEKKLAQRDTALMELADAEQHLCADSDLREKHKDVLADVSHA